MELSLDLPNDVRGGAKRRSGGNVSAGRSACQVVPHSLTHSLTHSLLESLEGRRTCHAMVSHSKTELGSGFRA